MESGTRKTQDIQRQQQRQVRLTIQTWLRGQQTLSEPFLYRDISKPPHGTNAPCGGFGLLYLHRNIAENKLLKNQILCSFFISIHFIHRNRKERILVSNSLYWYFFYLYLFVREFPDVVLPYMAKPDTEKPYVVISPMTCIQLRFSNRFRDLRSVSARHTLTGHCR